MVKYEIHEADCPRLCQVGFILDEPVGFGVKPLMGCLHKSHACTCTGSRMAAALIRKADTLLRNAQRNIAAGGGCLTIMPYDADALRVALQPFRAGPEEKDEDKYELSRGD